MLTRLAVMRKSPEFLHTAKVKTKWLPILPVFFTSDVQCICPTSSSSTPRELSGDFVPQPPELLSFDEPWTQFGRQAFAVCGPDIWNTLPQLFAPQTQPAFRRSLKHTYFILLLTSSYSCFYHWLCNARSADFFRIIGHYNIYLWYGYVK